MDLIDIQKIENLSFYLRKSTEAINTMADEVKKLTTTVVTLNECLTVLKEKSLEKDKNGC